MSTRRKRLFAVMTAAVVAAGIAVAALHNVPLRLTANDRQILNEWFAGNSLPTGLGNAPYALQIAAIKDVQALALEEIRRGHGIAPGQSREPGAALAVGEGECYDRTRFLEKTLKYAGLPTRHASVYLNPENLGPLRLLTKTGAPSHAVTEVLTARGWLIVDSNNEWLGLAADSTPVSLESIHGNTSFLTPLPAAEAAFYRPGTVIYYGLYSRHGGFFPPFNRIPDISWRELLFNL